MKLGEFIEKFSHNNMIRLHYKENGGNICVLETWNDVSMDWEILKAKSENRHYIDNEVLGLVGIYFPIRDGERNSYPEAINIVIEKLENQPFIDEVIDNQEYYENKSNT